MSYTPNSFVGVLYVVSFLMGTSYGAQKVNHFKDVAKNNLIAEIKTTATAEKSKSYQEGFEAGIKSTQPKEGAKYNSEIERIIGETTGTNFFATN
ncbi:hypothetical protein DICPUDRAFT_88304 [Dictyostelium purpureum]|uniref:ATP synthase subunit e, mitochondrial n=1 Tax=Dictyostelium purpureum TaxID=5786 RepID=F0ZNK5_DICPU|nr:uncharacterized protein DICPUDRAFT_88304 [Dictyostelium purpureum]EGC34473.1 hypothetical protein DICPUDRAFT_88304 [Dictyostelium purpureum]|eukprot:XP_003289008.1 hypothetical protein DICPUDRAFT_88304 [Dictyostelium purpureum]